ncbi:DUF4132 domain-containing protein [Photobacterium nomapromontoriensis]|uniref:DUF4132 domain-containing protein n=1 Tax=Photobacterium nomapromontoriensis TaxID=2910237 RepID=UPI003D0DE92F
MILTSQEKVFLDEVSYPFICFDGYTVTDETPYKELHVLFHVAQSENVDFANKLQQPGCDWVLIEHIYAEGKTTADHQLKAWLETCLKKRPLLGELELLDYLTQLKDLQKKHPILIDPIQPYLGKSILSLSTLSEAVANLIVEITPHLEASQHWASEVIAHRCSYMIALKQQIEQHGWQNADRITALANAICYETLSSRGVNSLIDYQPWVNSHIQHDKMHKTFSAMAQIESYANYHQQIYFYCLGHPNIAKIEGYQHACQENFVGFGYGDYPLYHNDPLAEAEAWLESYFEFNKTDDYGRSKPKYPANFPSQKEVLADTTGMGAQIAQVLLRRIRYFQVALDASSHAYFYGASPDKALSSSLQFLRKTMIEGLITPKQWVTLVNTTTHSSLYLFIGDQVIRCLPMLAAHSAKQCSQKQKAIEALAATFNLKFGEQNGYPRLKGTFDFNTEDKKCASFAAHLAHFALDIEIPFSRDAMADICPALTEGYASEYTYSVRGMPVFKGPMADELHQLEQQQLLQATVKDHWRREKTGLLTDWLTLKPKDLVAKLELVRACHYWADERDIPTHDYVKFATSCLRKKLDLNEGALAYVLDHYLKTSGSHLMKNVSHWVSQNGMPPWLQTKLAEIVADSDSYMQRNWLSDNKKVPQLVTDLLNQYGTHQDENGTTPFSLAGDSPLIIRINQFLANQDEASLAAWRNVLVTAATITGAKASAKQLKQLQDQVDAIGNELFSRVVQSWIVAPICATVSLEIEPATLDLIRGLLAATPFAQCQALEKAWYDLGLQDAIQRNSTHGVSGNGLTFLQYFESQGNAIIRMLGNSQDLSAIVLLNRLRMKFKLNKTRKLIEQSIEQLAAYHALTRGELEDLAIPDHGLTQGHNAGLLGEYRYEIDIHTGTPVKLAFFNNDDNALKSVPAAVKTAYGDELKVLRAKVKAIQEDLSAQKSRVDREIREPRSWTTAQFEQHYFNHPLMSVIARTLVWVFESDQESTSAIYHDGTWRDALGHAFDPSIANCTVKLWHPIDATEEETLQWRNYILQHSIVQSIKQVFREIYLLTDAEVATRDHSLRMAAHIVRQHQFVTLARGRGWTAKLMTFWDYESGDPQASISTTLPYLGMEAHLHVLEPYDNESNDMGVYTHMITDRLRFVDLATKQAIAIADIPARALSEILRDCDLFVGVASIGADPNWTDERYSQGYQ